MSDYLVHLAIFIAIILLGIEATVILIRNGASWLLMLLFAVVFLGAGMLEEGYDTAFAWLMPDAITEQTQFFDIEWRPKITALLLRSWMWIFAIASLPAAYFGRLPAVAGAKGRGGRMR